MVLSPCPGGSGTNALTYLLSWYTVEVLVPDMAVQPIGTWPCSRSHARCRCCGSRAVVVLSIGARPFTQFSRPLLEAYAGRTRADLHVVDSLEHVSLRAYRARLEHTLRFLKLPLIEHYLRRYNRVLYLDDDVLVGPRTPDLFAAIPCKRLGVVVERHKPQSWHAMHWRVACGLYGVDSCAPNAWSLFNSGLMLLSQSTHAPLVAGWTRWQLTCRVLCDQLFFNAAAARARTCIADLGSNFNYVGSELRRALVRAGDGRPAAADAARRRAALRDACVLHLTRKVPKLYTADWVVHRALARRDVLQCARNATASAGGDGDVSAASVADAKLLSQLPTLAGKYDIGTELCAEVMKASSGAPGSCVLQPWVNGSIT